ncbi:MAG TPA: serine/threonine-protein kinase [Polyangiaceae bacterium]|nr:serine/threonine-protein kinase [Polyangiaceae bacterium]
MTDDTILQFGQSLRENAGRVSNVPPKPRATTCPTCASHFSPDGRFCPFDGTPLVPAEGWDPSDDALIGSVIDGRYEVLSVIGEGGMGTVYQVRHTALGKRFALKALRKDLAADGEIAARFIQEARTAAAVSHPGLVEITDFGRLESGQVYFVMELLEGQSLASLLRSGGPLPAARGLDVVRQLVHALKAAHDSAIVHRDLKPDNIHISKGDGERDLVKIVDFGLAKVIGSSKLTRSGMVFGTPHYMSPEQASGELVDHRADIYAFGIVMYEMFTGKVPFEADSYMGVLTKHMYMTPAPPSELRTELKEMGALEDVILRCLQKRPSARYENLAALLADLDQRLPRARGGNGARLASSVLADQLELPTREEVLPLRRRRSVPVVVVAIAFLAGLLLVVLLRRGGQDSSAPFRPASAPQAVSSAVPARAASVAAVRPPSAPPPEVTPAPSDRVSAPARKPSLNAPRPAAAPAVAAPPPRKRKPFSGEIVDPWAK